MCNVLNVLKFCVLKKAVDFNLLKTYIWIYLFSLRVSAVVIPCMDSFRDQAFILKFKSALMDIEIKCSRLTLSTQKFRSLKNYLLISFKVFENFNCYKLYKA